MSETKSASQQQRETQDFINDRAGEEIENSTLVKRFKIKKRPIIYDLSGTGATDNKPKRTLR